MAKEDKDKKNPAGLFIPAGALIGLGLGFLYSNLPAGVLTGLGVGFAIMAVIMLLRRK